MSIATIGSTFGTVKSSTKRDGRKTSIGNDTKKRGTDPATSQMEYASDETEFLRAVSEYRSRHGKNFITPIEAFSIVKQMGFARVGMMV